MKISTIGGNINENSGGLRGLKYGVTRDYVIALEIVLANGDIIRTGASLQRMLLAMILLGYLLVPKVH